MLRVRADFELNGIQHKRKSVALTGADLREVMAGADAPRSGAKRTARAPPASGGGSSSPSPLAYHLDALTQQKVKQGMQAVPFV